MIYNIIVMEKHSKFPFSDIGQTFVQKHSYVRPLVLHNEYIYFCKLNIYPAVHCYSLKKWLGKAWKL